MKYIEKGVFPETRRTFQVTRCNHCEDAPCVEICPTTALFQRKDGIVDFDGGRCIGCKACMQGCPYDALYIDPQTETAAKCNFCPHKVEVGLEPPCVTVCPTQAIVAGDLHDPASRISQMVGRIPIQVRKPEKGTRPKVFYVDGDADSLVPSAAPPPESYMWASAPQAAALIADAGRAAAARAGRTASSEQHRNSWGWKVSAYLWTKSIAAGRLPRARGARAARPLAAAAGDAARRRHPRDGRARGHGHPADLGPAPAAALPLDPDPPAVALVADPRVVHHRRLRRPPRAAPAGRGPAGRPMPPMATGLTVLLAAGTAVYTAFLFGQSKGRDLWQSALLAPHLIVQAVTAGAAVFQPSWLLVLLPVNGLLVAAEVWGHHQTEDARRAARLIQDDPRFSTGVLAAGHLLPLTLLWGGGGLSVFGGALAGALALFGLLAWEHLYVQAPQQIPLA